MENAFYALGARLLLSDAVDVSTAVNHLSGIHAYTFENILAPHFVIDTLKRLNGKRIVLVSVLRNNAGVVRDEIVHIRGNLRLILGRTRIDEVNRSSLFLRHIARLFRHRELVDLQLTTLRVYRI